MQGEFVTVYDQSDRLLAVLDNASDVSYVLTHNDLWTASFSLPADDPKNAYCQAHNLVRIPDGSRDIGLYRIVGMPTCQMEAGGVRTYSLEHVMATLLDDVLFGYHEIGGEGISTRAAAEYILSKQTVKRWRLGACDFADEYAYKFENTALLSSLLSLANVLTEEYTWTFDASSGRYGGGAVDGEPAQGGQRARLRHPLHAQHGRHGKDHERVDAGDAAVPAGVRRGRESADH